MRIRVRNAIIAMMFLAAVAVCQTPQKTATLSSGSATVLDFKGEVVLHAHDGSVIKPQRGQTLSVQSSIETAKGTVLLNLQDGSQVLVKEHSKVVLKAPDQGPGHFFELLIGNIIAKVQKRFENAPSFRMGTPTAVITVRGTRFLVSVDKKSRTRVDVFEGVVEVAAVGMQVPPVVLRPGFGTQVDPGRQPENPRQIREEGGSSGGAYRREHRDERNDPFGREREKSDDGNAAMGTSPGNPATEQHDWNPTNPAPGQQQQTTTEQGEHESHPD